MDEEIKEVKMEIGKNLLRFSEEGREQRLNGILIKGELKDMKYPVKWF